jgi:hypothetical protein
VILPSAISTSFSTRPTLTILSDDIP